MKIIRTILFSLLALGLIAFTGLFILFQVFDADRYLSQITSKASLVLGRPVSIGHAGLGLSSWGVTLDAGPVTIADDLDFTSQPFIKVDKVRVSLDLRSLIFQHEIHITGILLQSPQIHFIRSLQGQVNTHSLGQARGAASDSTAVKWPYGGETGGGAQRSFGPKDTTPPIKKYPALLAENRVWAPIFNLMKPKVPIPEGLVVKIQDASISYIDQNQVVPLDIWLRDINAGLTCSSMSRPFQLSLKASLYSDTPNVHASALISAFEGKVFGDKNRGVDISDLVLDMDLSRVNVNKLKGISPEIPDGQMLDDIAGMVQLNMAHLDIGSSRDITGDGEMSITGGIVKNFNIFKTVLSPVLGFLREMGGDISNLLNGQLKDKLGADDTIIEKAQAQFSLHDKTIFIGDSLVQTNILELTAKGSVDQGLKVDMQTMLHLNADVSTALVNEFEGLKLLCDDSQRIAIGANLEGVIPHLKYKPDKAFRKKSRKVLMEEGGNILSVLLGGGQTVPQGQNGPSPVEGKKFKKNFKNIFKGFL